MRLTSIESSFHPCNSYRDCPRGVPRRPKCAKNVLKWRTFELVGWITGKQLKIDGYMLRCVLQALHPLFIHVTFTAIVPGVYPGRPKCALGWLQKLTHVPLALAILILFCFDKVESSILCVTSNAQKRKCDFSGVFVSILITWFTPHYLATHIHYTHPA